MLNSRHVMSDRECFANAKDARERRAEGLVKYALEKEGKGNSVENGVFIEGVLIDGNSWRVGYRIEPESHDFRYGEKKFPKQLFDGTLTDNDWKRQYDAIHAATEAEKKVPRYGVDIFDHIVE